ncbi:MAG: endolytic transglycosylase MltG [bacterium]
MKIIIGWLVTIILVVAAISWLTFVITINRQVTITLGTLFTVEAGESVSQIAFNLAEQKLIRSAFFFKVHAKLSGQQGSFQAGEYLLDKDYDTKQLMNILVTGQALTKEKVILIREGLSSQDIAKYLTASQLLAGQEFQQLALTKISNLPERFKDFSFLSQVPSKATLEGYLFPDTYRIFQEATVEDLVVKMLDNFQTKVTPEMMTDIADQKKDLHEIIIMASLIEKEVRTSEDMAIVSGIFWNRIQNGQALQSCATLAYILGENKPQYTTADTEIDSPYNTYQNQGLPPGPIANPGLNAIKAAIYPKETDYNYFLSRPDTGETVFAKTYEDHLANKAKYLD